MGSIQLIQNMIRKYYTGKCNNWLHFSPVGLIKHHILHAMQLQVHLLDNVHETTGGTDDSGGK